MIPLILNAADDGGGAARAANRLHKGLQRIGIDSKMLVQIKNGDDPTVAGPVTRIGKGFGKIRPYLDCSLLQLYPNRKRIIFSPSILPGRVPSKLSALNPDVIHLHWITGGFLRVEDLRRFRKPLFWTLHDSWAFTGGCHIPLDCTRYTQACGRCPTLGSSREHDLSRSVWRRKRNSWQGLDLTVVTPSRWLAECARSSSLFRTIRIEVIPNGLDVTRFRPVDKELARELLSLPTDKKLILFGAEKSTTDTTKGFHLLVPALRRLAGTNVREAELVVFGSADPVPSPDFGMKAHYLGRLHDDVSLALLYSAADVFVSPSISENLPNTAMEAMACGTPCVAFNVGGMPDLIEHERTGHLARPFDPDELANGIAWVLENKERWKTLSRRSREKVEREYAIEKVAARYADLYREILIDGGKSGEQK